jgi:hypothetical protein
VLYQVYKVAEKRKKGKKDRKANRAGLAGRRLEEVRRKKERRMRIKSLPNRQSKKRGVKGANSKLINYLGKLLPASVQCTENVA